MRFLVEAGADVNGMIEMHDITVPEWAKSGRTKGTPLHFAAKRGFEDVVRYLIDNGTDASKLNTTGYTATELAKKEGHDDIVYLIRSYQM